MCRGRACDRALRSSLISCSLSSVVCLMEVEMYRVWADKGGARVLWSPGNG